MLLQTIQKVLLAYAELVRRDFPQYTGKHDVVCVVLRYNYLQSSLSSSPSVANYAAALRVCRQPVITFHVSRRRREMYSGHARLCVCVSNCPRPHAHTTARTWMLLGGMVGDAPLLCTIGRICNRCMGCVAVTT